MKLQRNLLKSAVPVPDWWASKATDIEMELSKVRVGTVETISISPGKRPVRAVYYGNPEPELRGTANFNAAVAAKRKHAYYDKNKRQQPVLFILAGVHGQEVEGMMAAMSVIRLMETGKDLRGQEQPALLEKLKQLRLIVVPLANPDGRVRVPYDGWVGLPVEEMTLWGQGSKKNGEPYGWRRSKGFHPMIGDVDILGGYFDDAGINMMHDEWSDPMSETTRALLKLTAKEGPDCVLNLHSYGSPPGILSTKYVPHAHAKRLHHFQKQYGKRMEQLRLRYKYFQQIPEPQITAEDNGEEQLEQFEAAFNLQSMLYHVGADFGCTFESAHGVYPRTEDYSYENILKSHDVLFEVAAEEILCDKI